MNKEQAKSAVREALKGIYQLIDDDIEAGRAKPEAFSEEQFVLLMISARALRLMEEK